MNQEYKIIFSDIDGTLLNSNHNIGYITERTIKEIIKKGIPFIPISARPPYAIIPYSSQLGINNHIICYSGALILDNNLKELYSITINEDVIERINKFLSKYSEFSLNYYAGFDWFTNNIDNFYVKNEEKITGLSAIIKHNHKIRVHKILIMGDSDKISNLEKNLKKYFPELSIHRSKNEYLEIMDNSVTKANAIKFIEKLYNIKKEEIIAFGDNFNDLDMLQYVGLGVAMGNSPEEIKAIADKITLTNDQDGIAVVLKQLFDC